MRSIRTALVAFLFSVPAVAIAQGSIEGTVLRTTRTPFAGATVRLPSLALETVTGTDGVFLFSSVVPGRYVITVAAADHVTAREQVIVGSSGSVRVEVILLPRRTDLEEVVIRETAVAGTTRPAPDLIGTLVTAGARSEVISLDRSDVNLAEKVGRQVFARVPGLQVYDMDGAGNQTNVSTRGLDPHRSWEMNVRQDGVSINSDVYGYPASHYSPPMEAMERVELVRGTAALQYGTQFGGLINYVTRRPDASRAFSARSAVTTGGFGLTNAFAEAGGRVGKLEYQLYGAWRESDGFRDAARSRYNAQYLGATWHASERLSLRAQVGRSFYIYRIPGPLTDAMFEADPTQATRTRNWFSPTITVPAVIAEWKPREGTHVSARLTGVLGDRSSVQFVGNATVADVPNGLGQYGTRAVDIDDFNSRTLELRLVQDHRLGSRSATLATGIIGTDNLMRRRQQGVGSRGSDYDLSITGTFGRDLEYDSRGIALYVEELVRVTPRWRLIPGVRLETGTTEMTGTLAYYDPAETPRTVEHDFPLLGLRTEYDLSERAEAYLGWSQAYRPMLLKDLLPESATEVSDPNMEDAQGYTVETGVRGRRGGVSYDVGAFLMRYDKRFGTYIRNDGAGDYVFKANVGSTRTLGLEVSVDAALGVTGLGAWRSFLSASLFDAIYREGVAVDAGANVSLVGNRVEGVPGAIIRTGLALDREGMTAALQVSHTAKSYGDPFNTETPTANGARGIVPAYTLLDLNGSWQLFESLRARLTVSNLLDARYFTKRPAFYPGAGVWPSDGRSLQLGLSFGY